MALQTRAPHPARPSSSGPPRRRRPRAVAVGVAAAGLLAAGVAVDVGLPVPGGSPPADVRTAPVPDPPAGTATTGGLTAGTRRAYRAAAAAMRAEGIAVTLNSGYRTPAEQQQLYEQAIAKYGSQAAARVWVLPPDESQHVRGVALDVGPKEAARWLDEHGARYGLCRTMDWEWWHFEYAAAWQRSGACPPPRRRP